MKKIVPAGSIWEYTFSGPREAEAAQLLAELCDISMHAPEESCYPDDEASARDTVRNRFPDVEITTSMWVPGEED